MPSRICSATGRVEKEAAYEHRGNCLRRPHRRRQGAERRAARHPARRARAPTVIAEALRRAPGIEPAEIDDVILGCAMPEGEQGMNVARIASLRAGVPVTRIGGHRQPLLLVRPAGDCLRRGTRHGAAVRRRSSPAAPSR